MSGVCRICGCTETEPCPVLFEHNDDLQLGCGWVEPDLCDVCDTLIDRLAVAIDQFTQSSASSAEPARYTAAINKALSEASGRLRKFHAEASVECQIVAPTPDEMRALSGGGR